MKDWSARHSLLAAFVAGLLLAHHPVALALVPLAAARRPWLALALIGAALGGAFAAHARVAQLDRTALPLGNSISERATLLDVPRETPFGGWQATVGLLGERVALTAARWVPRPEAAIGAQLRVSGGLKPLSPAQAWMRTRNVHAALSARAVRVTDERRGGPAGFVDGIRARAERALEAGAPARVSGLLRGMVLGEGEALDQGMQSDFRAASLSHLVAASGQNVALLAALAVALGMGVGLGRRGRITLALALVALYVPLAGAGPSIQRAGIMGGTALVAALAGRPGSRAYALLLAAAVTLLVNPRSAGDPGWQMSFAAVVAIAFGAGRVSAWLRGHGAAARRRGGDGDDRCGHAGNSAADRTALRPRLARRAAGQRARGAGGRTRDVARCGRCSRRAAEQRACGAARGASQRCRRPTWRGWVTRPPARRARPRSFRSAS